MDPYLWATLPEGLDPETQLTVDHVPQVAQQLQGARKVLALEQTLQGALASRHLLHALGGETGLMLSMTWVHDKRWDRWDGQACAHP